MEQNYLIQLEQLNELMRFMDIFKDTLDQCVAEFRERVEKLREQGLTVQTAQAFETQHIGNIAYFLKQAKDHIDENTKPFIRQNIELTEKLIELNQNS